MNNTLAQTKFTRANQSLVEDHVSRLIAVMDLAEAKVACSAKEIKEDERSDVHLHLHIEIDAGDNGRVLIGTHGHHLQALQHLIRSVIRKQLEYPTRITVDVNGYLASREQTLLHLAEEAARKAGRTGRAISLPPMAASQRRTVHASLASRQDINTESLGEEPNRRVVVRPIFI